MKKNYFLLIGFEFLFLIFSNFVRADQTQECSFQCLPKPMSRLEGVWKPIDPFCPETQHCYTFEPVPNECSSTSFNKKINGFCLILNHKV